MRRMYLVARREFIENLRTKTFWIGILSFPVLLFLAFVIPALLEKTRGPQKYSVLDQSGWLLTAVEQRAEIRDVVRILQKVSARTRSGRELSPVYPQVLRDLAPLFVDLDDPQLRAVAVRLLGYTDPDVEKVSIPAAVRSSVVRQAPGFRRWWKNLTPRRARELDEGLARARFVKLDLPSDLPDPQAELNRRLQAGEIFAYFVIGPDPLASNEGCLYVSRNLTDMDLRQWFTRLASEVVRARRIARAGLDPRTARWIQAPLQFASRRVTEAGVVAAVREQDALRQWAPVAFVYLLWVSIFTVAQMLVTNTIEEKSNRIIEVLLSSVTPGELMAGKIIGITATGLTVIGSWLLFFLVGLQALPGFVDNPLDVDLSLIVRDPIFLLSFVSYFLLGYLLYAAVLVSIGSVCNSLREAQNLQQPIILLLIIPLLTMVPIARDPNGLLARVLSFFPPYTPFVMMNRAAGPPAVWEYVATTLLLLVSIVFAFRAAGRIFRVGILMTGKPPRLREIVRWMRVEKGAIPERVSTG